MHNRSGGVVGFERRPEGNTRGGVASASGHVAAGAQQREPLRRVAILVATTRGTPGAQERVTAFFGSV